LILGWHNIDPTPAFPAPPGAGRRGFESQLRLLAEYANVIPLTEALDLMEAGEPLPSRAAVLTFDDGYQDAVRVGVPTLARFGLPATFFLVPDFLSGRLRAWWEDLAESFEEATVPEIVWDGRRYDLSTSRARRAAHLRLLESVKQLDHVGRAEAVERLSDKLRRDGPAPTRQYFLDWETARALLDAGHSVGSHSRKHAILSREDPEAQALDLQTSRAELETGLGTKIDTLAYPNGTLEDYDDATIAHAREVGYRCGLTTRTGLAAGHHSRYEMRRVVIGPTTNITSVVRAAARKVQQRLRDALLESSA
jgi:peptidoglycan/xylan/chitin deacetylase (PgdA/CDA1 family)